jgi:hypothetical protein
MREISVSDDINQETGAAHSKIDEQSILDVMNGDILAGVALLPIILPAVKSPDRLLLSKLIIHKDDDSVAFQSITPLDGAFALAINFIRACAVALRNSGAIHQDDFMLLDKAQLLELLKIGSHEMDEIVKMINAIKDTDTAAPDPTVG